MAKTHSFAVTGPSSQRSGEKSAPLRQAQADRQRRSPTKPRRSPNSAIVVPVTWLRSGATKKKRRLETTVLRLGIKNNGVTSLTCVLLVKLLQGQAFAGW